MLYQRQRISCERKSAMAARLQNGNGYRRPPSGSMFAPSTVLIALAVVACEFQSGSLLYVNAQQATTSSAKGCVTDYDPSANVDYFPDKAVIAYAENFDVEYFNSYKVLTTMSPWSGNTSTYVLYQCGTTMPVLEDVDVLHYISVPVKSVATGTPSHIPRIELLGQRDSIVAYVGDTTVIGSPCVDELVADGAIVEATATDAACGNLDVDVTFMDDVVVAPSCENSTLAGVHYGVGVYSYLETGETSGLAEGEAIKLFSLFYNEEKAGNELFDKIENLWFCTKDNAQGCSLKLNVMPSVAWFGYVPTDPAWPDYASGWTPPETGVYYHYAIDNAGGNMLTCEAEPFSYMSDEAMLECFGNATICVFAADYAEVEAVMNSTALSQLDCVKNKRLYDVGLSGMNAWFEAKTVEPHVLIEDMVVVLHGDDFNYGIGDYERLLLRNVATEDSESGTYFPDEGSCADPSVALEIQGECDIIVDFATCEYVVESDGESPAARNAVFAWATVLLTGGFAAAAAAAAAM